MTTTLADRLLDADGALHAVLLNAIADAIAIMSDPKRQADMRATRSLAEGIAGDLRLAALTYAAAWHEVNGATPRAAAVGALTRARADLAAMTKERDEAKSYGRAVCAVRDDERKAWQDATG
nr:hypothetical protein [Kofleriaceae bacterium]